MGDDRRSTLLLGVLHGDALGAGYEFGTPDPDEPLEIRRSLFGHPAGRGTDDTETTVAVARGLLDAADRGGLDTPEAPIADRLLAWYETGPADVGNATSLGLATYRRTRDPLTSGPDGDRAVSNGSLMRSAPFALAYADPTEAAMAARRSSATTHRHPTVIACVDAYVHLLDALLDDRPVEPQHPARDVSDVWMLATAHAEHAPVTVPCSGIGHAPYALTLAYWAAISPLADDYETGVELVVRAGGDTDTNGAICGAVLAARHGFPGPLVRSLDVERVHELLDLAEALLALRDRPRP